jgi:hypothetical protein
MFTICTAFAADGALDETLEGIASSEKNFTREIGVISRRFFQCSTQPHIIWSVTEWESEKHHNDAAQSIMKTRRDDRIASIQFGPDPYFEIFCNENSELRIGEFSDDLELIVIAHGVIDMKERKSFLKLRKDRTDTIAKKLGWLRTYHNTYISNEFVAFLGFTSEEEFNKIRRVGDFFLEEYLFTGLREPLGMSCLASYNQFICTALSV